ncbi:MAG: hypothetical protein ACREKE_00375, partial [bacterium]
RGVLPIALLVLALTVPALARPQSGGQDTAKNAGQARAALNAMVQALGGQAWLDMKNKMLEGHVAAFYQGRPDLGTTLTWEYHQWPDRDRIVVTKHRDVDEFFIGRQGWEVTYQGKRPLPKDQVEDYLRRRDHSIETAVKVWMKDPKTLLLYEGPHLVESHLGTQVTLISAQNQTITIVMDADTHLPLQQEFQWRDPFYHDLDTDAEEYDDYHTIQGFPTPFTITRFHNGQMTQQYFVVRAAYNQTLPPNFWDVDAVARRVKR